MATIKSFTDLSQSKALSKILPLESSDMVYLRCDFEDDYNILVGSYHEGYTEREDGTIVPVFDEHIPCWSLAALLGVLPKIVNNETLFIETSAALWHIGYRNIYTARTDNPVDACYEIILKLYELNLL